MMDALAEAKVRAERYRQLVRARLASARTEP